MSLGLRTLPFAFVLTIVSCSSNSRRATDDDFDTSEGDVVAVDNGCNNASKDPGETDVDCGGTCGPCADGKTCGVDSDCASGACSASYLCSAASCSDGMQGPSETGTDCGGDCPACLGESCGANGDCSSAFCNGGVCDTPSCIDGIRNGAETAVDCGGGCGGCTDGFGCLTNANCLSGFCNSAAVCASPTCGDSVKNGAETDVDCGGVACSGCSAGQVCTVNSDCESENCEGGTCGAPGDPCANGTSDPGETDVDCGGETCGACGFGKACLSNDDCATKECKSGACAEEPSCTDLVRSPGETDVDCGGVGCPPCAVGKECDGHTDCLSETCIFGICEKPTCDDDVHNGKETATDCGGTCAPCPADAPCVVNSDCQTGLCSSGVCCAPNACGGCGPLPVESCNNKDDDCDGATDEDLTPEPCPNQKGVCKGSLASCSAGEWTCTAQIYAEWSSDYSEASDVCDGADNDCDGSLDESGCSDCGKASTEQSNFGSGIQTSANFATWRAGEPVAVFKEGTDIQVLTSDTTITTVATDAAGLPSIASNGTDLYVVYPSQSDEFVLLRAGGTSAALTKVWDESHPTLSSISTGLDARGDHVAWVWADSDTSGRQLTGLPNVTGSSSFAVLDGADPAPDIAMMEGTEMGGFIYDEFDQLSAWRSDAPFKDEVLTSKPVVSRDVVYLGDGRLAGVYQQENGEIRTAVNTGDNWKKALFTSGAASTPGVSVATSAAGTFVSYRLAASPATLRIARFGDDDTLSDFATWTLPTNTVLNASLRVRDNQIFEVALQSGNGSVFTFATFCK